MKYRREIDGLRALAVLPVIFFHAGFGFFGGGFVGVDVFFVISGYLITQILLEDLVKKTFSIARFYERRARRILPALFCVMLVTVPFAFLWMLPSQYEEYARSLVAVVTFVSNILFWNESGYFAAAAEEKPLLHTWSLGVEEQFYVFFPLALFLLWKLGRQHAFYIIAAVGILSLGVCEYASRTHPSANFFLIPMRAWELVAGSLCAFLQMQHGSKKNDALSLAGLALIVFAILYYDAQMRLPSLYMLAPVIGTVLILRYGTTGTPAAKMLSLPPFVGVGLISYSAYLWHQPFFAFARIRSFQSPDTLVMLALTLLSLVLATLTWKYIEQPFRIKTHPHYVKNGPALVAALAIAAVLTAIGIHGHVTRGRMEFWNAHASPKQIKTYQLIDKARQAPHRYDNGDCMFMADTVNDAITNRLIHCSKKYGKGIAVIGDSHAMNLSFMLREHAQDYPFMAGISKGMCRPHPATATCYYDTFLKLVATHPGLFHDVIYEEAGSHLLQDENGKEIDRTAFLDLPLDAAVPNFVANAGFINAVTEYLETLARHSRVIWLGPRMEPQIRENALISLGCDYPYRVRPNQERVFDALDDAIAARLKPTPIRYVSQITLTKFDITHDFLTCETTYWTDGDHYSPEGEAHFSDRVTINAILGNR